MTVTLKKAVSNANTGTFAVITMPAYPVWFREYYIAIAPHINYAIGSKFNYSIYTQSQQLAPADGDFAVASGDLGAVVREMGSHINNAQISGAAMSLKILKGFNVRKWIKPGEDMRITIDTNWTGTYDLHFCLEFLTDKGLIPGTLRSAY